VACHNAWVFITTTHALAIHDLFRAMNIDAQLTAGFDLALQSMLHNGMEDYEDCLRSFLVETVSLDALREPLTQVYASRFSEDEVLQLLAFYKSPLGQRMAAEGPSMTAECAAIGQQAVMRRMPEMLALLEREQDKMLTA